MPSLNINDLPYDLYNALCKRAKEARRSLSGEVIYLLHQVLGATQKEKGSILGLRGLGKKQWKGVDAAKHVAMERDSWE